jgi:hypothetical protein
VMREVSPGVEAERMTLTKEQGAFVAASGGSIRRRDKVDAKLIAALRERITQPLAPKVVGATIGVNFVDPTNSTTVLATENPGVVPGEMWNNVSTAHATTSNLSDDSGVRTTADITVVSGGSFGLSPVGTTGNTGFNKMVEDAVTGLGDAGANAEASVTVSDVPYSAYDVYVFTQDRGVSSNVLSVTDGSTTYFYESDGSGAADSITQITGLTSGTATPGGSYALFSGLSGSSFTVTTGGAVTGVITNEIFGIHIVNTATVPEPSTKEFLKPKSMIEQKKSREVDQQRSEENDKQPE